MSKTKEFLRNKKKFMRENPGWRDDIMLPQTDCQCLSCKHLIEMGDQEHLGMTCAAFPRGIPWGLWRDEDHRFPLPYDNGFRYEPKTVILRGKKVGYVLGWDLEAYDAETGELLMFYSDVR